MAPITRRDVPGGAAVTAGALAVPIDAAAQTSRQRRTAASDRFNVARIGVGGICAGLLLCSLLAGCESKQAAPTSPVPISASASTHPAAESATDEAEAGWLMLFDGTSLRDWRADGPSASFSVRDGRLVVHGPRSHLYYLGPVARHDFRDFELRMEAMTFPGANSGVYFHTAWQGDGEWPVDGYEVQVNNTQRDPKRTGGLYGIQDNYQAPARDHVWFTLTIRVEGKRVTTFVDGKRIVDYTEEVQPQRTGEFKRRLLGSGTFALQAHDPDSEVHYRNIRVRLLP